MFTLYVYEYINMYVKKSRSFLSQFVGTFIGAVSAFNGNPSTLNPKPQTLNPRT